MRKISGTPAKVEKLFFGFNLLPYGQAERKEENLKYIKKDLPRQTFLGIETDELNYQSIYERWEKAAEQDNYGYNQGDMTGLNIVEPALFHTFVFSKQDNPELMQSNEKKRRHFSFGFVNDYGEACGASIAYMSDNPKQWIFGILRNADKPHKEREYKLFLFNIDPINREADTASTNMFVLLKSCGSVSISKLLGCFFNKDFSLNFKLLNYCVSEKSTKKTIGRLTSPLQLILNSGVYKTSQIKSAFAREKESMLRILKGVYPEFSEGNGNSSISSSMAPTFALFKHAVAITTTQNTLVHFLKTSM